MARAKCFLRDRQCPLQARDSLCAPAGLRIKQSQVVKELGNPHILGAMYLLGSCQHLTVQRLSQRVPALDMVERCNIMEKTGRQGIGCIECRDRKTRPLEESLSPGRKLVLQIERHEADQRLS